MIDDISEADRPELEIEITQEMIEAGAKVLCESGIQGDHAPYPQIHAVFLVRQILQAVLAAYRS